uniref:Reverse transcriptase domain, reverse transcriptase zinc-binding domain protein n=1 Tax=Tanacetum cinerariifolium TaxID=118510 RepID=A0A699GUR0_TANCI|nr:reverse transcriptase domain, reverse transcriptase zinc-binding domain protein [Tanacetum cinerariifolium]
MHGIVTLRSRLTPDKNTRIQNTQVPSGLGALKEGIEKRDIVRWGLEVGMGLGYRDLIGRTCGDVEGVLGVLQNVVISNERWDLWRWNIHESGSFTVRVLTKMVEERTLCMRSDGQETIWIKLMPEKVNIFVWRALKGRLPMRVELDKRGVDLDTLLCPCCNDIVESCDHSLVLCFMAMGVWEKIYNW